MKTQAIVIRKTGGPEVMQLEDVEVPPPGPGEALIRQDAIGVNFIDVYFRSGLYPSPKMPLTLGMEGAGVVEAVGQGVTTVKPGDRVGYCMAIGSYAKHRNAPADKLLVLPKSIPEEQAASVILQGLTAHYLLHSTYAVKRGDTILVHAAAGGVGLIMCQWAKHLGATVIGTVSTEEKAALAKAHGCDYPILYTREDFVARVKEITKGALLPVVYDSVGKDTYMKSLDCLRPRGLLVSFGQASGPIPPFDLGLLAAKGSLFTTRASLGNYCLTRYELEERAKDLFDMVGSGVILIRPNHRYALKDAAQAHRDLEGRKTTGSIILVP